MKRSRPTVLYLPGIRSLAEFEFKDDEKAIRHAALEHRKWLDRQRKRLRKAASEQWQQTVAKEDQATERLLNSYRAAMRNEMERTWLEQQLARVKKVGREIARDMARAERKELLRRGVVRGRRK